jgi:hypothetical protein
VERNRTRLVLLVGLAGAILLLAPVPAAVAQTGYPPGPPNLLTGAGAGAPNVVEFRQVSPTAVAVRPAPVPQARPLARTGADISGPVLLTVVLLGMGTLLFVVGRRRPHPRT